MVLPPLPQEPEIECGLTNEYATFEAECPKFDSRDSYIPKLRARKNMENKESDNVSYLPAVILTYLFGLISFVGQSCIPNVTWVLPAVGVVIIGISLCLFFHARGRNIWGIESEPNKRDSSCRGLPSADRREWRDSFQNRKRTL